MAYAVAFEAWGGYISRRPTTPPLPGGPGAGDMDTRTMAHTGVTTVSRLRGVRALAGCVPGGLPPCRPAWGLARAKGRGKQATPREPAKNMPSARDSRAGTRITSTPDRGTSRHCPQDPYP